MSATMPKVSPATASDIMRLQTALNRYAHVAGFRPLRVDGVPGSRTHAAYTLTLWWLDHYASYAINRLYGWTSSSDYPEWYFNFAEARCYKDLAAKTADILDTLRTVLLSEGQWHWRWLTLWDYWTFVKTSAHAAQRQPPC